MFEEFLPLTSGPSCRQRQQSASWHGWEVACPKSVGVWQLFGIWGFLKMGTPGIPNPYLNFRKHLQEKRNGKNKHLVSGHRGNHGRHPESILWSFLDTVGVAPINGHVKKKNAWTEGPNLQNHLRESDIKGSAAWCDWQLRRCLHQLRPHCSLEKFRDALQVGWGRRSFCSLPSRHP